MSAPKLVFTPEWNGRHAQSTTYLGPVGIEAFITSNKVDDYLAFFCNPVDHVAAMMFVDHFLTVLGLKEYREAAHCSDSGNICIERGELLGIIQPPMVTRDHEVPGITNEREFETLVPGLTE